MSLRQEGKIIQSSNPPHATRLDEVWAKDSRASFSTTVAKALSIIEILSSYSEEGISLIELSSSLNMPKSTVHRYLATLLELRLAERTGDDRFRLGTRVIELAGSYLAGSDLRKESESVLDEMAEKTGETVHLAVPSGAEVVYIAKVESRHTLRMFSYIGARLPMHCTALGKSILAFSADERVREVLPELSNPRTPHTITSEQALLQELDRIRVQGFALDNEENETGICCVGAPILDYTGQAIAAMSVSGPCDRMDQEYCIQLGPVLREAVLKISKRKGFIGMSDPR
jgi:DNA-binding IclR family transcriptional regulator